MITLDVVRTEYSFGQVYGQLDKVIAACTGTHVLIADNNTWGHVPFYTACKKAGKVPLLGVVIGVVDDVFTNKDKSPTMWATLVAVNDEGLKELYGIVNMSYTFSYYQPRIGVADLVDISKNIRLIVQNSPMLSQLKGCKYVWVGVSPSDYKWSVPAAKQAGLNRLARSDNYYPSIEHKPAYEILCKYPENKTSQMHILTMAGLKAAMPGVADDAFSAAWTEFCKGIDVHLPKAENIHIESKKTLKQLCLEGAKRIGVNMKDKVYVARLDRELKMIASKQFEDYFYLVADLCTEAKKVMLVGPGRGSSAGSLVCYLLGITTVDPLMHDLLFERFIDITRADLPDIDIDFPDKEWVFKYLSDKYGVDNVAHIGTILCYQAKSAITDVGKALNIPEWELKNVKDAVIERSGGDQRAAFCLKDTFESLDVGKALLVKYPAMAIASDLEEHAKSSGVHAAGIIICNAPVQNYCGVTAERVACIDKKDAEKINILKVDVLGLRTLIILQDVLEQIGENNDYLYNLALDDEKAFEILTVGKYAGIFQFEGYALKSLTTQMGVHSFDDIVSITSLARPGPLHNGAASEYVQRRIGAEPVTYMNDCLEPYLKDTYGTMVYQEQIMAIVKNVGNFSWEDTTDIRKAMSKTMGEEYFNQYIEKFVKGAETHGIKKADALDIWKHMSTHGSWSFNKSHGVSYGLVSYWCAHLKANWPLEFAAATLRNLKDSDQAIHMLRELVKEGFEYIPFDAKLSTLNWSVQDGKLVGGWLGVKGVGEKKAVGLMNKLAAGSALTAAEQKMVSDPVVAWDDIFEAERLFGHLYKDYEGNGLSMPISYINDVNADGEYIVIGKLKEKNLRDANEYGSLVKRGGKVVKHNNLWLNLRIEDDTGEILVSIPRGTYEELGKPIVETGKIGDWYMFRGKLSGGWRKLTVEKLRRMS
jgi:DNA polymerase III alpha subunit